jgi:hypothetical protein
MMSPSLLKDKAAALTAAFAESGHGILTGMITRPRSQAGPPMTLGNMRANGVRSLDVCRWLCHHRAIMSAEPWPDSRAGAGVRAAHRVPPMTLGNVCQQTKAIR